MKHKKFVKQLQAIGLDRNGAESCAEYCQENRETYTDGLDRFLRILGTIMREATA